MTLPAWLFAPTSRLFLGFALLTLSLTSAVCLAEDEAKLRPIPGPAGAPSRFTQRTMRRLAESTPEKRNTVRILFYGQSITEQGWWRLVADDLRSRFPHANLVIENRALGGYSSQHLVKTAETDLYPFQPDLLIFHVYGAHDKYAYIIRRVRERTTAEILMQNDHVNKEQAFDEETDPAKLPPAGGHWDAFMNHNWLPQIARKYDAHLCDQRSVWKRYLKEHDLPPSALLKDGVHLNEHGERLMAACVSACLVRDASLDPSPAEEWVTAYDVGSDLEWKEGKLRLEFEGTRVDAVVGEGSAKPAAIRIDGKNRSEIASLYGFTRMQAKPGGKWPPIANLSSETLPVAEEWTLTATLDESGEFYTFTLYGSKTGPDGEGRSDERFVSSSGRVVIDPEDWNVDYAMALAGVKPKPKSFVATWKTEPRFDEFDTPGTADPAVETTVTLAQGLSNGPHVLEILGAPSTPIRALRVYRPPLQSAE